jgi:hypothetical protein
MPAQHRDSLVSTDIMSADSFGETTNDGILHFMAGNGKHRISEGHMLPDPRLGVAL